MLKALKKLATRLLGEVFWLIDCNPIDGIVQPWASGFGAIAI